MKKEEFVTLVLDALNWQRYNVVKKKHGNVPQIIAGEFLESVFEQERIPEIALHFGVSVQTINRLLRTLFPDIRLDGKRTWKYYLLDIIQYKSCLQCERVLPKTKFYIDERSLTKTMSICKRCDWEKREQHYKDRPDLLTAARARRRARELNAAVSWADQTKITAFYTACPEGYEVDHIIPLQGETVCGLHVENNLQHLPMSENRKKSNKLLPEYSS